MTLTELLGDKRPDILRLAAQHGARNVRIFGSLARGEARPDSDVDLLITLEPERSLLDLIALQQDLEDSLGCKVDVVTEAAVSPYIRPHALQDAVVL
jgi:predicted nucleotidyltransferase